MPCHVCWPHQLCVLLPVQPPQHHSGGCYRRCCWHRTLCCRHSLRTYITILHHTSSSCAHHLLAPSAASPTPCFHKSWLMGQLHAPAHQRSGTWQRTAQWLVIFRTTALVRKRLMHLLNSNSSDTPSPSQTRLHTCVVGALGRIVQLCVLHYAIVRSTMKIKTSCCLCGCGCCCSCCPAGHRQLR
jgi:hypothetical protein